MTQSLTTAPIIPPEVEAELKRLRQATTASEAAITTAKAERAHLDGEVDELAAAMNENRATAAVPELQAADFAELAEWHTAVRDWRSGRSGLDEAHAQLEGERNRKANEAIPAVAQKIDGLRFEIAQHEFDAAKLDNVVAQQHAKQMAERVDHYQRALWSARHA